MFKCISKIKYDSREDYGRTHSVFLAKHHYTAIILIQAATKIENRQDKWKLEKNGRTGKSQRILKALIQML